MVLAQAALFVALRDHPIQPSTASSPWTSLTSRRFGGDVYSRRITLQTEDTSASPISIVVNSTSPGIFDITVADTHTFTNIPAHFAPSDSNVGRTLLCTLDSASLRTNIVPQSPPPNLPASAAPNASERLHVFHGGVKTTLVLPSPKWLLSLGGDVLAAGKGGIRAPMPSLVVDVRVAIGEKVEKGQPVVVLESMKTETVLRAEVSGIVKAVGCKKGEMVEEGRELIEITDEGASK